MATEKTNGAARIALVVPVTFRLRRTRRLLGIERFLKVKGLSEIPL